MTQATRLRLDAADHEMAALHQVLLRFSREAPDVFARLFAPVGPLRPVHIVAPEVVHLLAGFGLVEPRGDGWVTAGMRVRQIGPRFYVMALGGVTEYRQDVWPETDAMLAELTASPPGRLLDLGTGTGVVAIEAAVRGHTVVATDVYETALSLARFNARLAGAHGIDFRQGHLFDPVAGEQFDLVLTAPHYTRVADQLRLEVLRAAPAFAAPGGRVVIATFLEWDGDGPLAVVPTILEGHAAAGHDVTVRPLVAALKQAWFTVADPEVPIPGLLSRHRFLVELRPGTGRLKIERPSSDEVVRQHYVPLSRPGPSGRRYLSVVHDAPDVAALDRFIEAVRGGVVTFQGAIPSGLLDACRWGAMPCVTQAVTDGAAGAVLDLEGRVRPCAHGDRLASVSDTMAEVCGRWIDEALRAAERRGCATCEAAPRCSRCLFPHAVDEASYCNRMRAWLPVLPYLHRALAMLPLVVDAPPPLRVKLHRAAPLVAAAGRPLAAAPWSAAMEERVAALAERWDQLGGAVAVDRQRQFRLIMFRNGQSIGYVVQPFLAELAELVGDGANSGELAGYALGRPESLDSLDRALGGLAQILGQA